MNLDETLNEILVKMFQDLENIEEKALITGEFSNISVNDMHVIEAVGIGEQRRMTEIARRLHITTGTLTKSVDGLETKHYLERIRSKEDKRVVHVLLTDKGVRAYEHHARFHRDMIDAITEGFTEDEVETVVKALSRLSLYFQSVVSEQK